MTRWLKVKAPRDGDWQTLQMTNIGADRYVIDLPRVSAGPLRVEVEADQDQDALDGAALRHLKEASGEMVESYGPNPQTGLYLVQLGGKYGPRHPHEAPTIAEAADKCREALWDE